MSDARDGPVGLDNPVGVFSKNANSVGTKGRDSHLPRASEVPIHPHDWRSVCRRVVLLYRESLPRKKTGDFVGATILRNRIMEGIDEPSAGSLDRDKRLTRADVEHWLKREIYLNDDKFSFIDRFVRKVQLNPDNTDIVKSIIDFEEGKNCQFFAKLYQYRDKAYYKDAIQPFLRLTSRAVRASDEAFGLPKYYIKRRGYRHIVLYVRPPHDGIFPVTVCYLQKGVGSYKFEDDILNEDVRFGYLIPTAVNSRGHSVGLIAMLRRGTAGIYNPVNNEGVAHSSSSFRVVDGRLVVTWEAQIATPHYHFDDKSAEEPLIAGVSPMGTSFIIDLKDKSVSRMEYMLSRLTDRYLLW